MLQALYNIQDHYSKRLLRSGLTRSNFPKQVLVITPMHIRDCGRPCLNMWLVISAGRSQEHHRPTKVQKAVGPAAWTSSISNTIKYSELQYSEVLSV